MIPAQPEPYKIPRELERRPPRSVRRKPGTLGCSVIIARVIALIFLGVGIALLAMVPITIAVVTHGESQSGPIWFAIAAAVISNGLAFLLIYYIWIIPAGHKRLCRYGKPIVGHIVKMHSKSGKTTTYYLDYQFDHPGLRDRIATLTVQPERWHQARVGEP